MNNVYGFNPTIFAANQHTRMMCIEIWQKVCVNCPTIIGNLNVAICREVKLRY